MTAAVPRVLAEPAPAIELSQFAADGLELKIVFWIGDLENGQGNARSAVNLAVLRTLDAAGVEIPFPQRVMRTVGGEVLAPTANQAGDHAADQTPDRPASQSPKTD